MSIDREINQRVEAYGNNPGALKKRYAASKELIDLLALQRLKSQKDAAARKIQMEMEQMPGTIKAQREQELMGQNVQDLTKRTADTMRNMAQKKQMQAVQKGMAERAKGLAGLTQNPQMAMAQQNRPQQPQRMQAGGIVALRDGGDVETKRKIQSLINRGLSDEEIKERIVSQGLLPQAADKVIKMVREQQREDMTLKKPPEKMQSIDLVKDSKQLAEQGSEADFKPTIEAPSEASRDIQKDLDYARKVLKDSGIETLAEQDIVRVQNGQPERELKAKQFPEVTDEEGKQKSATQLVTEMGVLEAPKIDTSKAADEGLALAAKYGMGPDDLKDPEEYRKQVRDDEADFFRRDDKRRAYRSMIVEREDLEAKQEDPKKLRRDRLKSFLLGAGGANPLQGSGIAAARTRAAQEERARGNIDKRFEMLKTLEDQDMEVAKQASAAGRDALREASAMRRVALDAVSRMSNQQKQVIMEQARLDYSANKDNVKNILDAAVADGTTALRLAIQEGNDLQRFAALSAQVAQAKADVLTSMEKAMQTSSPWDVATTQSNSPDAKTAEEGRQALERMKRDLALRAEQHYVSSGLTQLETTLRDKLAKGLDTSALDDGFGRMTVTN